VSHRLDTDVRRETYGCNAITTHLPALDYGAPKCKAPASARRASQAPATARVGSLGGGPQPRSVTIVSTTF
jgi:hypothetical protein